jgi:hypothetical protein
MTDGDQHQAERDQPGAVGKSEGHHDGRQRQSDEKSQAILHGEQGMDHEATTTQRHDIEKSAAFQLVARDHEQHQRQFDTDQQ